uniref:Reverse transcriptase domain-containing protein n=1 Tax=Lactuca sativa TaxID=4236 RepID=A0A9R1XLE7_LACSA|nr:hypothetical protein LSAT_V11C300153710 [Lactuca sativa]
MTNSEDIDVGGCWDSNNFGHATVDSTGRSGGILSIWDESLFNVMEVIKSRHFLITIGQWKGLHGRTIFANVCGPHSIPEKRTLWENLSKIMNKNQGNWIIFGDFNVVRHSDERINSQFCHFIARDFNQFIHEAALHDVKMGGHRFTYFCRHELKLSKLDRFLVCSNFLDIFPNTSVTALPTELSDHCPLLLSTNYVDFGPRPFRFFNGWMQREDFNMVVDCALQSFRGFGTPDMYLAAKLKYLKDHLKKWRTTTFPKEMVELNQLKNIVDSLDTAAESRTLTVDEMNKRKEGNKKIIKLEKLATLDLKKKLRVRWAVDGDENTRFFHEYVNNKNRKNTIYVLTINGSWSTDAKEIMDEAVRFFEQKFKDRWPVRPKLIKNQYKVLSDLDSKNLEEPFMLEEIKSVVWACANEKSPRPDGFTFKFIKHQWERLKYDIFSMVKYFEQTGRLARGCNSSFITLVSKVKDPLSLGDFRPISLIGCLYKIIPKVLACRLKKVVGLTVDEVQSTYVDGRSMLDGPLIVNEICSWSKKMKKEILLFKVDFDKSFDYVNWSFLDSTLMQMGYGEKWCNWIRGCLTTARSSVLVNGAPTKEFALQRGVRKGDPLSPFLFIIAMDGLNVAMKTACAKGLFQGIKIPISNKMISHLFYADDALFIGEWDESNIKNLARILRCFHISSGLKVNFHKSKVFGVGVSMLETSRMAAPLCCEPATLPVTYLGVLVGANMNLKKNWQPVIDRFNGKLSSWKAKSLSFGGRLTLIKSVLGNLPTYFFSLFV